MKFSGLLTALLAVFVLLCGCEEIIVLQPTDGVVTYPDESVAVDPSESIAQPSNDSIIEIDLTAIPAWDGEPYVVVDGNEPGFTTDDLTTDAFEQYSSLDALGRCGTAYACVSRALLADEERDSISSVIPTGWVNREYDFIDGNYLYNRCHLLGFQLTGENANERNLITGTRYMNIQGMLPFENLVANHVRENAHHVLYRVTPVFQEEEQVCRGVQMEGYCVECGNDDPFMFHVFCYNVQPGVQIDYATGDNSPTEISSDSERKAYVMNKSSRKFHDPQCTSAASISEKNREEITCTREELICRGYDPCGACKP